MGRFVSCLSAARCGPLQFEIGVADMAIGIVAISSFWRSFPYKAALVVYFVLFYIGVAIGHIRALIETGDVAATNFGLLLILTLVKVVILPALLWYAQRNRQFTEAWLAIFRSLYLRFFS